MEVLNREDEEDASEIRTYLASFNREIEPGGAEDHNAINEEESDGECNSDSEMYQYLSENELDEDENLIQIKEEPADEPDYYTDLDSNGESIHKTPGSKGSINVSHIQSNGVSELLAAASGGVTVIPSVDGDDLDDQQALEMVAKFAEQAVANASQTNLPGHEEGNSSYQTVTIVPSDTNPGELSYVLFVSQDDDNRGGGLEAVYDFENPSRLRKKLLSKKADISKLHTVKLSSRKYQMISPQHVCAYCSYSSPKRYLLARHMKSHSEERPHKCGVCERGFKTLASLQNHVNTHTGTRPHPCKECDSCFTTSGELVRHVRYKHTHEKPHKCTECDYASVELSKLKRHMRCHTGERPYQCPHCTYASPDTYKLKRHLRIHTGEKPYECDICQTRFTQSNSLKAHKLIHSGNKPVFRCEYCPTTCGRKTDLRIHMEKLHSSDNPHRCKRCGKVFLDRYSYKIHVKSHDGEKCFKCDLCDYASISHRHLETHMLVHTDQKPFHCDECDMSFRQKQLLKRHKNLYHDPNYVKPEPKEKTHVCGLCFKAFRHKGNLIRHYAIHDPEASVLDREVALRLGEPKEPGEDRDGEEDEEEEDILKEQTDKDDDDQIVVFEVIQLPPTNGAYSENQAVTMVDGSALGVENQDYSIIQSVDEDDNELLGLSEQVDFEDLENISASSKSIPKRRYQNLLKTSSVKKKNSQIVKKRKIPTMKKPSKVVRVAATKATNVNDILYLEDNLLDTDDDSEVREQMNKDFKDCFGFDDKDDILAPEEFPGSLDVIS